MTESTTQPNQNAPDESQALMDKLKSLLDNRSRRQGLKHKYGKNSGKVFWRRKKNEEQLISPKSLILAYLIIGAAISVTIFTGGVYVEIGSYIAQGQGGVDIHNLGADTVKGWFLIGWPLSLMLWFVSWCLNQFEVTFWGLIGFGVFLYLQFTEIRPLLLRFSPSYMKAKIEQIERHQQIQIKQSDSLETALYKDAYNNYYTEDLLAAERNRNIAFVVDIGVMLLFMPLIHGLSGDIRIIEVHQYLDVLTTDINIGNVIRLIMSAFGINWIVAQALEIKKNAFLLETEPVSEEKQSGDSDAK